MDQKSCITVCARTLEMLTVAFGESTMSRTQVQLWYNQFKEGRENVNDVLVGRARQQTMKTLKSNENDFPK